MEPRNEPPKTNTHYERRKLHPVAPLKIMNEQGKGEKIRHPDVEFGEDSPQDHPQATVCERSEGSHSSARLPIHRRQSLTTDAAAPATMVVFDPTGQER